MARAVPWVCGVCRAVNQPRWSRCYSCRAPRTMELDPARPTTSARITARTSPDELARLAREAGSTYRSASIWAIVVTFAIVVVTGLHVAKVGPLLQLIPVFGQLDAGDVASIDASLLTTARFSSALLTLAEVGAWLLAFFAWGAWLSRVVANVPALGGGWTRSSPREAFLSSIVPLYNLFWMPSAVRDAVVRLSRGTTPRNDLISGWWLTLVIAVLPGLGLIPGPLFAIRLAVQTVGFVLVVVAFLVSTTPFTIMGWYSVAYTLLLVPAALLAVAVVGHVQALQAARVAELASEASAKSPRATSIPTVALPVASAPALAETVDGSGGAEPARPASGTAAAQVDDILDLGPHAAELEAFIETLGLVNRDEVGRVHRQGLSSGLAGGTRGAILTRALDAAAAASQWHVARDEARSLASRASARSPGRVSNRYMVADECAGLWAEVIVLRDHLPLEAMELAFEPWQDVLVRPAWLGGEEVVGDTGFEPVTSRM